MEDQKAQALSLKISEKLHSAFPTLHHLAITDTSGGCGSSFRIIIVADEFKEMKLLQRHQRI